MSHADDQIDHLFKRLHLAFMRNHWRDVVERAERGQWAYRDLVGTLASEEVAHRAQTGVQRRTRAAKFPFIKTLEEFNFSMQSTLRAKMLGSYCGHELVAEGKGLVLHGRPGRGKTHLAIAIAYKAILNGYDALFTTAAELIEDLHSAAVDGRLYERLKRYVAPAVLIVDEVGYLSLPMNAANVLYHVVNARYLKHRPIIVTTNKALTQWGEVLHDQDLADTIVDRLLERGRLITLDGPSLRNPDGIGEAEARGATA